VRQAVRQMLALAGSRRAGCAGGYVLAAVHNIQDDVPPENVRALLDAGSVDHGSG
jgi:hypothetical protein